MTDSCLVLRLAAPLQSWGVRSQFRRRDTASEPTKGGVVGLLAAAEGRRRGEPIEDLLALRFATRIDRPGVLLRDYHTVSDYRHRPLLSVAVDSEGRQRPVSTGKTTEVSERLYLADALFIAVLQGGEEHLLALHGALRAPQFPLALGRRACVPTQPLTLPAPDGAPLWSSAIPRVLGEVPWQPGRRPPRRAPASLLAVYDDDQGDDTRQDVTADTHLGRREFRSRRVSNTWVRPPGLNSGDEPGHDPFSLLGW